MVLSVSIDNELVESVVGWSSVEDATPLVPLQTGAGVGRVTLDLGPREDAKRLTKKSYDLEVRGRGTTKGTIAFASGGRGGVKVDATSRLGAFVTNVVALPVNSTLQQALTYYFSLAGVDEAFYIDPTLESVPVIVQGFKGSLWDFLSKELAPVYGFEIAYVSDRIVVRGLRQRDAVTYRHVEPGVQWSQDAGALAQSVKVAWYDLAWSDNVLVYPRPSGWDGSESIITVDGNEVVEVEFDLETSILSVQQPVPVDVVLRPDAGSVYSVTGGDNLPITAAQWNATGGRLEVEIGEDSRTLIVRVTGPNLVEPGPYRIAVSDGRGDYSSLRVRGAGVTSERHEIQAWTGLTFAEASTEVGEVIDSRVVRTAGQAWTIMARALESYSGSKQTISASSGGLSQVGDTGTYREVTVAEFEAMSEFAGKTIDQVNDWIDVNLGAGAVVPWVDSIRNLAPNPDAISSGAAFYSDYGVLSFSGGYARSTARVAGPNNLGISSPLFTPVTAGQRATLRAMVRNPTSAAFNAAAVIYWFNASTEFVGQVYVAPRALAAGATSVYLASGIVPAGATQAIAVVTSDNQAAGGALDVTAWGWYVGAQGSIPATDPGHFSGSTPSTSTERYLWEGAANASPSLKQVRELVDSPTIEDVNDYLASTVADEFENQAFGNVAGARMLDEDCLYRITSATISRAVVQWSATDDTTVSDVNGAYAPSGVAMTVAQVNAMLAGATIGDVNTHPLKVTS